MANEPIRSDPISPITDEADWDEKGWARESETLTAAPRLGAMISISFNPKSASAVRRAARLLGMTRAEFVHRAAVKLAVEA